MFLTIDLTKEAEQCAKIYWDGAYAGCKIITLGFSSLGFAQGKEINLCPHFKRRGRKVFLSHKVNFLCDLSK